MGGQVSHSVNPLVTSALFQYMDDDLSYFANVFLGQIKGDVKFYRKKQVAYTYSDVSKDVVKLVCIWTVVHGLLFM